jgi:DNA repair ATPase RecN
MLADQSRERPNRRVKSQVVSITQSPSVAAIADMHILVQRQNSRNGERGNVHVRVTIIDGADQQKRLVRMTSGDLAPDQAELLADALLRDGVKQRRDSAP